MHMLIALALAAQAAPVLSTPDARDVHSYAEPLTARVTHVSLDLAADFTTRVLRGTATLDIQAKPTATTIVLDDNGLRIAAITDARGRALPYTVGPGDPIHGSALTVRIGQERRIRIAYATAPGAKALQWLSPEQTAGKAQPYLFSQGQAILNRSWIPTQDSPGVRQTWDATIAVPCALTAVMSAARTVETTCTNGRRSFGYRMDKPVAPYLIALAVGRPGVPSRRQAHRHMDRAGDARQGGVRVRRAGEVRRRRRIALWPLSLGPLRRPRPAALLPLRRHGEPDAHLRHADRDRRRPQPGQPDRA